MSEENSTELVAYEIMAIIEPDITEIEYKKHFAALKDMLEKRGAEITHEQEWGKRELAYLIKKNDHGFYVVINFMGVPENLQQLEGDLRITPFLLRHLIIKTPNGYEPIEYDWDAEEEEEQPKPEKKERKAPKVVAPPPVKKEEPKEEEKEEEEEPEAEEETPAEEPEAVEEEVEEEPPAKEEKAEEKEEKEEPKEEAKEEKAPAKEEKKEEKKDDEKKDDDKMSSERLSKLDEKLEELLSSDNDLNL
jgi:ribosomal protein S6